VIRRAELPRATEEEVRVALEKESLVSEKPEQKTRIAEGRHTILYVEDNLRNLALMRARMEHFETVTLLSARTGREGLDIAFEVLPPTPSPAAATTHPADSKFLTTSCD